MLICAAKKNTIGNQETGVGTGAQPHYLEDKTADALPGTDLGTPPVDKELGLAEKGSSTDQNSDVFVALVEAERGHDIKLRTLSWQKTAVLHGRRPVRDVRHGASSRLQIES